MDIISPLSVLFQDTSLCLILRRKLELWNYEIYVVKMARIFVLKTVITIRYTLSTLTHHGAY